MKELIEQAEKAGRSFYYKHQYLNLQYREVIAEAYLQMLESMQSWDPTKGCSRKTWATFLIHRNLRKKFVMNRPFFADEDVEDLSIPMFPTPQRQLEFIEGIESLSGVSQLIVSKLFDNSYNFTDEKKNAIKRKVKQDLQNNYGISMNKIQTSFREICSMLRTISERG